ncbi:MAG: transglutaminaseTgpA domain-containing protein [Solirubrobacteraceae bacterium]
MAPPDRQELGRDWVTVALMLVAFGLAFGGLSPLLAGSQWWLMGMVLVTVVLVTGAIVRSFARHRLWGVLGQLLAGIAVFTALNAPDEAFLGFVPTGETLEAFRALAVAGGESIAAQSTPADPVPGILYLVCIGAGALAFAMDLFVSGARMPVLAGLPLLLLLLVPSFVDPASHDPLTFLFTALVYLALLLVGRRGSRRPAVAIGAVALVLAVAVPPLLPAVEPQPVANGGGGNTGLNPFITLGDDLRRGDPAIAYTYTSTQSGGQYFRLTVLEDLGGVTWRPDTGRDGERDVTAIGEVPGLGEAVPTTEVTTLVKVGDIRSEWLPLPYAPRSVTGLEGRWTWDAGSLAVRSDGASMRGQEYEALSLAIAPSIEQLVAAPATVPGGFGRYVALPGGLPDVVAETAERVAGDAANRYEAALALQAYFRDGDFTYSELAPVERGFDGGGAEVLAEFLEVKAGYCVHFSSAMATMARTLGIPARIAVGFTGGTPVLQEGVTVFRVTTHDFHAWPELYFEGVGWVRFEPTPGRGELPAFAAAVEDDPATPDVDESVAVPTPQDPAAAPEDPATGTEEPSAGTRDRAGAVPAVSPGPPIGWILLGALAALLVTPAITRIVRRERRMVHVAHGSSLAAWAELRDTVHDLGRPLGDTLTPRQVAEHLRLRVGSSAVAALERLTDSLEHEAYGTRPGVPDVHDVRLVRRSLSRRASLVSRVLAVAAPRSLLVLFSPVGSARSPVAS